MVITNARLRNKEGLWDIAVKDGKFSAITPAGTAPVHCASIDAEGKLVIPPYVDSHIHLDYAFTAGIPHHNMSGTLFEGIKIWSEHKIQAPLTEEYMKANIRKTLEHQISYGVQHVRSHVDTSDSELLGLKVLLEMKKEYADRVDIQLVAFPQEGIFAYKNGAELLEEALKLGADCVGGIPHYEYTWEYGVKSVEKTFELAQKYDKLIDIHCDEIDDEASRFLETVAALGAETAAGHYTSINYVSTLDTEANKSFLERYHEKFGDDAEMTVVGEETYASVMLLAKALEKADDFSAESIIKAMDGISLDAPEGTITFDKDTNHMYLRGRIAKVNSEGKFEVVYESPDLIKPEPEA